MSVVKLQLSGFCDCDEGPPWMMAYPAANGGDF